MSGFLYFLPNAPQGNVSFDVLTRYGISHIVDSPKQHLIHRGCSGPENIQGVIVGVADRWDFGEVKNSDAITWAKFPKTFGQGGLTPWLGWIEANGLPTPVDLVRTAQLPGESITLADNNSWLVPIARDFEGACLLPRAYDLDDETGEWVSSKVRREYAKIWDHANNYYLAMRTAYVEAQAAGESNFVFTIPDGEQLVVDALAVNYRVSARELATLGVLVSGIIQDIADVLTDQRTDASKKKLASDIGTA